MTDGILYMGNGGASLASLADCGWDAKSVKQLVADLTAPSVSVKSLMPVVCWGWLARGANDFQKLPVSLGTRIHGRYAQMLPLFRKWSSQCILWTMQVLLPWFIAFCLVQDSFEGVTETFTLCASQINIWGAIWLPLGFLSLAGICSSLVSANWKHQLQLWWWGPPYTSFPFSYHRLQSLCLSLSHAIFLICLFIFISQMLFKKASQASKAGVFIQEDKNACFYTMAWVQGWD